MRRPANKKMTVFYLSLTTLIIFTSDKAFSQQQEYREYTVIKGDTLWSIANKEITDPFLWPKIWKENPGVKNPDLLYPGQKMRIPLYLLQKEAAPKTTEKAVTLPKTEPLAEKEQRFKKITSEAKKDLVDMETLISSGYISPSLDIKGEIIGAPTERALFGKNDYVYLRTGGPARPGDKYFVFRASGKVYHPETGDFMGYLIEIMGVAEVAEKKDEVIKARITESFQEAVVGNFLADFHETEPAFDAGDLKESDIKGFIVAARQRRAINGLLDIVYIDKGSRDGIEPGDTLKIMSENTYGSEKNGLIQVISTLESTATAVVRKSEKEVLPGDRVAGAASK